jgi:glycosyltransferase involved in cell wall biosynthesis
MTIAASHAEIERVEVGEDGVRVLGALVGADDPPTAGALVARRRSDGTEVRADATFHGAGFDGHLVFGTLPWHDEEPEFWDLFLALDGRGEVRLGRHLDDVANKRQAYVFPMRELELPAGARRFRPFYDAENNFFIRTGQVGAPAPAPAAAAPGQPAKRRVVPPHQMAAHRIVAAIAGAILRRRGAPVVPASRPKVTILIANAYGMGGTVRTCLNVAGFLAKDHDVEVISVQRLRENPFFPFPPGVKVRVVDDQRDRPLGGLIGRVRPFLRARKTRLIFPGDLRFARGLSLWTDVLLMRALWQVREGVVMGTRPGLNLLALMLKRPGIAVVGQEHMNLESHTPQRQREIARRYPRLDAVAVLTERDRETYSGVLGEAGRLEWIPNAAPGLDAPPASLTHPVVVAAGRLTPQKGFDMLIPAFAQVVERHPDWTLRICGGGPQRGRLAKLIMEHGLSNNVLLMGPVKRLDLQMSEASMYVLSSRFEGLPMVMIEAMSLGLPVVSFDCPTGPGDVIEDGRSGLLIPDGDIDALAAGMLRVIEDEPLRRALGAGASARAKDFSLDSIGPRWQALLDELASRG